VYNIGYILIFHEKFHIVNGVIKVDVVAKSDVSGERAEED